MIVPTTNLAVDPEKVLPKPSTTNLLMAAAEMHKLGRLQMISGFGEGIDQINDVAKGFKTNPEALKDFPMSKNIEDRRGEKYYEGRGRRGLMDREQKDMMNELLK